MKVPAFRSTRFMRRLMALFLAMGFQAYAGPAFSFPDKPVRIIVGFPAGGSSDLSARIVAEYLSGKWNVPVIVENRVGAGGTIAAAHVASSPPDGHTLLLIGPGTHAVSAATYTGLPYDAVKSFAPISQIGWGPYFILVNSDSELRTMRDLVSLAKTAPGRVSFASTGKGSGAHYMGETLAQVTGTKLLHVPYNGASPATLAVMGGQVTIAISDMSAAANTRSGKLRALAATTPSRSPLFPDIPTLMEQGVPASYTVSVGLVAAAGTPEKVIGQIHGAVSEALAAASVRQRLEALGFEAKANTPAEFAASIAGDVRRFGAFVEQAGLKQP